MPRTKKVAEVEEVKEVAVEAEAPKAKKTTTNKTTVKADAAEKKPAAKKTTKKAAPKAEKVEEVKAEVVEEKKPEVKEFKWRKATVRDFEVIISPIVTEKSQNIQAKQNSMVFKVKGDATANEIKDSVEAIFAVKVDKVNIINVARKAKRVGQYNGFVPGYKKAYVKLNKDYDLGEIAKATQEAE